MVSEREASNFEPPEKRASRLYAEMVANLEDLCRQQAQRYWGDKAWMDERGYTLLIKCFSKKEADICLNIAHEKYPDVPISVSCCEFKTRAA